MRNIHPFSEYEVFVEKLLDLYGELIKKNNEFEERKKKLGPHPIYKNNSLDYAKKSDKWHDQELDLDYSYNSLDQTTAANLIYCLALFENYLNSYLEFIIRNHEDVEKKFMEHWNDFFKEDNPNKFGLEPLILTDMDKMIEHIDDLLKFKKKTVYNFIEDLLVITYTKSEHLINEKSIFTIYREIRNLLIHRGDRFDDKFIDTLNKNGHLKKNSRYLEEFYKKLYLDINNRNKLEKEAKEQERSHENRQEEEGNDDTEELFEAKQQKDILGTLVKIDLSEVINSLIFLSSWLVIKLEIDKDKFDEKTQHSLFDLDDSENLITKTFFTGSSVNRPYSGFSLGHVYHMLLKFNQKYTNMQGSVSLIDCIHLLKVEFLEKEIKDFADGEKCNILLGQKALSKQIDDIAIDKMEFSNDFKDHHNLLVAYIKDQKDKFLNIYENLPIEHPLVDYAALRHEYIFQRWKKDLKKILNKLSVDHS